MTQQVTIAEMPTTLLPPEHLELLRVAMRGKNQSEIAAKIGVSQPGLSRFVAGGGLKPATARKLATFLRVKLPIASPSDGAELPSSEPLGEADRLATLTRIDHEWKNARYINLEIHLLSQPPSTYSEDVIGLARSRQWEGGDVAPWEWPERLRTLRDGLRQIDRELRAQRKTPEKRP